VAYLLNLTYRHRRIYRNGPQGSCRENIECKEVVIDQFSSRKSRVIDELGPLGKKVKFVQFHKGESDIAVACASVIARAIFLTELDKMEKEYYFTFPKFLYSMGVEPTLF